MTDAANNIVMNMDDSNSVMQQAESTEDIRKDRKNKLAAALRLFGKLGFDEGVAGQPDTGSTPAGTFQVPVDVDSVDASRAGSQLLLEMAPARRHASERASYGRPGRA